MNSHLSNVPALSVEEVINQLSDTYTSVIKAGVPLTALPSVMLWGQPGIGKSQAVKALADRISRSTGKTAVVTDVRLLLFNPIDLRGIPTANEDKTLAVWLKPKIFDMNPSDRVVNVLFLDEISAAPQSVQAAAYQITLDRTVGEHKLPDNCIVIAAGNRVTDKSVAYKMPKALANRLCHIEIKGSFKSWSDWAVRSGIDPRVLGFLSFRPDYLNRFSESEDELAYATPRSWEMVSNLLRGSTATASSLSPLIGGCVGVGVAMEFSSWCRVYDSLPSIEDIFRGKAVAVPKEPDVLYALISAMTVYAREHKADMTKIAASIKFGIGMPADFAAVLLRNYMAIEPGYKEKLLRIPEFARFVSAKGKLLNGAD